MTSQSSPTLDSQALQGVQTHEELLRFRIAMDMCGDAIYLVDRATMRFVDVNQTACARMGYSRDELLHMGPQDLLTVSRAEIECFYDEAIAAGASGTTTESTARTKDGQATVTELHRRALRMDHGWIIVSIARDITGRKHIERELLASEKRFRLTFEFAGSGIAHVDLAGRFRRVNRSLCEILGYSGEELVGRTVKEFSHPEDRDKTDAARARLHSGELESIRSQKRYLRKDGAIVWVNLTVALVRDSEGNPQYEIAVFDDDTERKNAEAAVRDSAEKLRLFADNIPAMTAAWDEGMRCSFANRRYVEFFGTRTENVLGKHVREILGDAAFREIECHFARALQGHPVTYRRIHLSADGARRHMEIRLLPNVGADGRVQGFFSVTADITEQKLMEERVQHVAHHDSLTGLPNRLLFNDRLTQSIGLARRESRQFALLYLDLDHFKPVNDRLGHSAGDELLQAVAARIRREVRESDTVARVGGDEFVVILPAISGREQAKAVARKIGVALAAPFRLGVQKQCAQVGISIGIAVYPADALDADTLVNVADAAMYRDKQAKEGSLSKDRPVGVPQSAGQ